MIPFYLKEQIKLGNVVLFLGAGASRGAKNPKKQLIPDGKELTKLIIDKFLGEEYNGYTDLSYVSDLAISTSSLFDVQNFIADVFQDFEPEPHHLLIPKFTWKSIFTTNYDLIVERAYLKTKSEQDLVPVIKNTPKTQIFKSQHSLPYYKIHGCITDINDGDAPLILTIDQFLNHKSKRDRLYQDLQDLAYDFTILFVGFGMADYDIRSILQNLEKEVPKKVKCYMVGPGVTLLETQMWEQRKVTALKMTFYDFLTELDAQMDDSFKVLTTIKFDQKYPIEKKFSVTFTELKPSDNFLNFIENEIDFINPNLSSENTDPKSFYKGYFDNWDPIIKDLDINRKIKDGILSEIFLNEAQHSSENQFLYLLKGNAGSGKSVLLKRIAFDAGVTLERFCIFIKNGPLLRAENIVQLYNYAKERIYLFVDNTGSCEDELLYLIAKCKKEKIKLTVITAERLNVWNIECQNISKHLTQSYLIEYLYDSEINELLNLLEKYDSLGTLKTASYQEKLMAFSHKAGKELLVALYEATNGSKPFRDIILDEYRSINNAKAQSLYLTTSIFHRLGTEARAGLISRLHEISFHDFKTELFAPLERIVFDKRNYRINDFVYLTRNRYIAEIIFENVLVSEQDRYDEYVRILNNLNIDYASDKLAFRSITNAKNLLKIFPDPQKVWKLYEIAETCSDDDPILLQQQAIFEMNSPGGSLSRAERLLQEATEMEGAESIIQHTEAELFLKKAEKARYDSELYSNLEQCISICKKIIKDSSKRRTLSPHAYHTILKAHIIKLKHVLELNDPPAIERSIKDIERSFVEVKQIFPNEEFILEIESSFNEIINNVENAKSLLERAFKLNMSSPFIALRLANFLERDNNLNGAISVVKDALHHTNGDYELNYKYGMLLQKLPIPNTDLIEYHLRRGFTMGDARYQAQFWYARTLFINNKLPEARSLFLNLSKSSIAPEIKNNPVGTIFENMRYTTYEGVINNIETSYAFITRDKFADSIFLYRYDEINNIDLDWETLSKRSRVSFNIAFNYSGPVAISVKIL